MFNTLRTCVWNVGRLLSWASVEWAITVRAQSRVLAQTAVHPRLMIRRQTHS